MREIKFRAWHKNEMVTDVGVYAGDVIDAAYRTYDTPNLEVERMRDAVVMQFTGLRDKNGVEIYEGDIVRTQFEDDSVNAVCIDHVVWDTENAMFTTLDERNILGDPLGETALALTEVIGNIHETPELLK